MADDIATDSRTPLLAESNTVRQRSGKNKGGNKEDVRRGSDWDPNLPYGGKVYLARRKKPDPWWITAVEVHVSIIHRPNDSRPCIRACNRLND